MFLPLYEQYPEEFIPRIEDLWHDYYGNDKNIMGIFNQLNAFVNDANRFICKKHPDFEEKFLKDVISQGSDSNIPK